MRTQNQPHPRSRGRKPGNSRDSRYNRFTHIQVTIEFTDKPTLGWELDTQENIRRLQRNRSGDIHFDCRYWRGMISQGLNLYFPEIQEQHPNLMHNVRAGDVAHRIERLEIVREFNRLYEQLPVKFQLSTRISYPDSVFPSPSVEFMEKLLRICGREVGWAPIHSADGFGRFRVIEVREISAEEAFG